MIIFVENIGSGPFGETVFKFIKTIDSSLINVTLVVGRIDENEKVLVTLKNIKIINLNVVQTLGWKWSNKIERLLFKFGFLKSYIKLKSKPYINSVKKTQIKTDNCLIICGAHSEYLIHLSRFFDKSWIHTVDPIPRDENWEPNKTIRNQMKNVFRSYFEQAFLLSSGNKKMSNYMEEHFPKTKFYELMDGLPDFNYCNLKNFSIQEPTVIRSIKLLYLGALYNQRNPEELIKVIESLNTTNKVNLTMDIYGFSTLELNINYVRVLPPVSNITDIINDYDILLDINSSKSSDLYISHKLRTYLKTDKPILTICSENSAVDDFLSKLDFQIQVVRNNFNSISKGLEEILIQKNLTYNTRADSVIKYEQDYRNQIIRLVNLLTQ